jgi:hypothetical protein
MFKGITLKNGPLKSNHKQVQSQNAFLAEIEIRNNDKFQVEISQT